MINVVLVFVGAGFGAVLRYALNLAFLGLNSYINFGTLASNLLGAFLAGIFAGFLLSFEILESFKPLILVGFLGGLTTYSSFSLEMASLVESAKFLNLATLILAHTIGSLALTLFGIWLVKIPQILSLF